MIRPLLTALFLLLALFGLSGTAQAAVDHRAVEAEIVATGDALVAAYDPAKGDATGDAFSDLYFNVFEILEADIGAADPNAKSVLESHFAAVISLAMKGAPKDAIAREWTAFKSVLGVQVAKLAESTGWAGAFLQSLLILLREGFEAILVVGALAAYLRRLGAKDKLVVVWRAVAVAVVASLATAWVVAALVKQAGSGKAVVEGATMLLAAAVLAYVSHWLFARREAARWQGYIREQVESAVSGGQLFSLGFAAFLAVYREGAETVLFYQALLSSAPGQEAPVAAGFGVAVLGLVAIYQVMKTASVKLPLGLFFTVTAVLLYALAVVFAGQGMLELQEARWIGVTPVTWAPRIPTLGLFPTAETLAAQGLVLALLVPVVGAWAMRRRKEA